MSDNRFNFNFIYKLLDEEKEDFIAMRDNTDNLTLFSDYSDKISQLIIAKEIIKKYDEAVTSYNKYFVKKQNVTNNYLFGLRACSSDLNLIKQKDYSQLIRLFKCAEEQSLAFCKNVEAFDELVTKLETGEFRIIKS